MPDNSQAQPWGLGAIMPSMKRTHQKGTKLEDCGDAWRIRYRHYFVDKQGVRRSTRLTKYFYKRDYEGSKRLAERAVADFMRQVNEGNTNPQRAATFGEMAEKWQALIMSQNKVSSQSTRRSKINCHLIPAFGSARLIDITPETVQAWVSSRACAPAQTKSLVKLMRSIWRYAKIWGYVQHNPFEGVKLPRVPKGNSYTFSPEQIVAILNKATGWQRLFFWILAETGMRPGECAGLTRADVLPRRLCIRQNVWNCQIQTPKTEAASRKPAISEALECAIRRHMEAMPPNRLGLIFASRTGRPISTHGLMSRTLRPILKKLGIVPDKRAGLYAFRHGNATLMDELGVPLKTRQSRLGHMDPTITLSHYTHAVDAADLAAADQIGALLAPVKGGVTQ